jgi:hypothetical protein
MLNFKNSLGTVEISGNSENSIRLLDADGLGIADREYIAAIFSGYDGQETISSRMLPRTVTVRAEICGGDITDIAAKTLRILNEPGWLYIKNGKTHRRIYCNQVKIPDPVRILKGRISEFAVQWVCDNPYFEDYCPSTVPLYMRTKKLSTPFTLPTAFGTTVTGALVNNIGDCDIEPCIYINCPKKLQNSETVILTNNTTGARIVLAYAPKEGDRITLDIKNRKIMSSITGNLLSNLSDDTFLGDFVLVKGTNDLSVFVGNTELNYTVECQYSNSYYEAVIV